MLRPDGIRAAFAAGIAADLAGEADERARDADLNESANRLAALPFVYLKRLGGPGLGWSGPGRLRAGASAPAVVAAPAPATSLGLGGRHLPR